MTIAPQNPLSIFRLPEQASFPFACFSVPLCLCVYVVNQPLHLE